MRVDLLTREFPPFTYGGAGVHVTELSRVLSDHAEVHVRAFDRAKAAGASAAAPAALSLDRYDPSPELAQANPALQTLSANLPMASDVRGADIVHSHTWYTNLAGRLASMMYDIPLVVTAHSLEPLRPWKREQLGGGYELSSWAEKSAYEAAHGVIAVSYAERDDILRVYPFIDPDAVEVIHNGIDLDQWALPSTDQEWADARSTFARYGLDPERPTIIFVGRITRQKGVPYLLRALTHVPSDIQVILCAGAPDTPDIAAETRALVEHLRAERDGVVWIEQVLDHQTLMQLEACSTTFVTPSIYEPQGIVNLEAMAMGLPVVGTNTGGIPDCVDDGVTGMLVPIEQMNDGTGTPLKPEQFEADMAAALTAMVSDPDRAHQMGMAGLEKVRREFTWTAIGDQTMSFYRKVLAR
ncbi:MAG: glycogen synthase [Actinomycetaceae bacterium]|nr:glycogen synthase [Actinomycetaceae bacterium]MDY6083229.1 glycogen synthase [Actinomycetaceae bacterium]